MKELRLDRWRVLGFVVIILVAASLHAQIQYREIDVKNGGKVQGTIRCLNCDRKIALMQVTKDAQFCGIRKTSPRLTVNKKHGVKDAVVYIAAIGQGKRFSPVSSVVLEQNKCEFSPHVMVLPQGTSLEIDNSDPVVEGVRFFDSKNRSLFLIPEMAQGQKSLIKNDQLEGKGIISIESSAEHPWMSAVVMTMNHPYYAVSDSNGAYTIDKIPPGHYTLMMWHEGVKIIKQDEENVNEDEDNTDADFQMKQVTKYYYEDPYELSKDVVVSANGTATIDFDLTLR